jgi:hypothetical protein
VIESLTGPFLPPRSGRGWSDWPGAVQVAYSTPTGQVPPTVIQALCELVGQWYRQVKTHADLAHLLLTEKTDGTTVRTYSWALTAGLRPPPSVVQLLCGCRVPPV